MNQPTPLSDNEIFYFIGWQEYPGHDPVDLYNLKQDVGIHPKGSTLAGDTLRKLGVVHQ